MVTNGFKNLETGGTAQPESSEFSSGKGNEILAETSSKRVDEDRSPESERVRQSSGNRKLAMREAIEIIVRALVDDVEAVDVREIDRNGTTLIEIRVAQPDMGKIIGKQGRTVRALRSLARAVGTKKKHRFVLEIME